MATDVYDNYYDLLARIDKGIILAEKLEKGNSLTSMREEAAWGLVARVLRDLKDGKEVQW